MPIDVTSVNSLDPVAVADREQLLIQMLTEAYPTMDFTQGGILQQLVTHPNTVLDGINRQEIANLQISMSLKSVSENPTVADTAIVDALLSNYMISRTAATSTSGVVAIVLSSLTTVTIPSTTNFKVNGRTFNPTATIIAVTDPALVVEDTNRLVQQRSDGKYWFSVNVLESVTGGAGLAQGVAFTMDPAPTAYVSSYAASDFVAGAVAQDNASFVAELEGGITSKTVSDRKSTTAMLKAEFPAITDVSIIGYGDFEGSRDRLNVFGVGTGGKADVYVRCGALPSIFKYTMMSMAIAAVPAGYNVHLPGSLDFSLSLNEAAGDWNLGTITGPALFELQIPPTMVPGFYRTEKVTIADPSSASAAIASDVYDSLDRGIYKPTSEPFIPFMGTSVQARYSRYQGNATVDFVDPLSQDAYITAQAATLANTTTLAVWYKDAIHLVPVHDANIEAGAPSGTMSILGGTSTVSRSTVSYEAWPGADGLSTVTYPSGAFDGLTGNGFRFYDVYLSGIAGLADMQKFLNDRQHQAPTADYLIKAAIPCFVGVEITIGYKSGSVAPDKATLQSVVADAINAVTFDAADLQASAIIDAVATALSGTGYVIMPIVLSGTIFNPDGTTTTLTSPNSLAIPDNAALGVSRRTVAYYAYPSDVNVTTQPVTSWSV